MNESELQNDSANDSVETQENEPHESEVHESELHENVEPESAPNSETEKTTDTQIETETEIIKENETDMESTTETVTETETETESTPENGTETDNEIENESEVFTNGISDFTDNNGFSNSNSDSFDISVGDVPSVVTLSPETIQQIQSVDATEYLKSIDYKMDIIIFILLFTLCERKLKYAIKSFCGRTKK